MMALFLVCAISLKMIKRISKKSGLKRPLKKVLKKKAKQHHSNRRLASSVRYGSAVFMSNGKISTIPGA